MQKIINLFRKDRKIIEREPQNPPLPQTENAPNQISPLSSDQQPAKLVNKSPRIYLLISSLILVMAFAIVFVGNRENFNIFYYLLLPSSLQRLIPYPSIFENKTSSSSSFLLYQRTPTGTLTPTPNQTAKKPIEAQFLSRQKIFGPVNYPENDPWVSLEFYKVGTISAGKYVDGNLILALYTTINGPCKGRGCGRPAVLRYIIKDSRAIFLPNISNPGFILYPDPLGFNPEVDNPFSKYGLSLSADYETTIPILEYPKSITGNLATQILEYSDEDVEGKPDDAKLDVAFVHKIFKNVYTTKPGLSTNEGFYTGGLGFIPPPTATDLWGCTGKNCFLTNGFFVFRPDGTFLKYRYAPPFGSKNIQLIEPKDIQWNDQISSEDSYISYTVGGCDWSQYDDTSVVAPTVVTNAELSPIGKFSNTDETIYGLKNTEHKLYTDFYNKYSNNYLSFKEFALSHDDSYKSDQPATYQEFLNSKPFFLWRDPFGRLIRFNNTNYLPPYACEPIIYLYPQQKQEIAVKLGKNVRVTDSTPNYSNGWKIVAQPSGSLEELSGGRIYPYLFWEGYSYIFSMRKDGYVVKKDNVERLFTEILPKLGLNNKEAGDFLEAWLPHFRNSPYYFITFLQNDELDKLFPLKITPKPDTVIRIFMDYRALDQPINVPEFEIRAVAPIREGFTVVEWGGLKRSF